VKRIAIFHITENGRRLAERMLARFADAEVLKYSVAAVESRWKTDRALVFIMASGIVVRTIAPLLRDKRTDPAVVVVDDAGAHAISLTGGHLGGANELAREIADHVRGEAVITTASDVNGLPPIDLWARQHGLVAEDWGMLPAVGTRYLNKRNLSVYCDVELELPGDFIRVVDPRSADVIISHQRDVYGGIFSRSNAAGASSREPHRISEQLFLRPRDLVVGIGCNSGTTAAEIEEAVRTTLDKANLSFLSVAACATIDIKRNEPGLHEFLQDHALPLYVFGKQELNAVAGVEESETVFRATGARAVSEPSALLAAGAANLLVRKQKKGNVTVAIARKEAGTEEKGSGVCGKIYVVGTGPGSLEHVTPAARKAITISDVIVGYGTYLDLIADLVKDKEVLSTGMTQEVDRCRKAVALARSGRTVSVISGGDPGIYAMAGLVYELLRSEGTRCENREKTDRTPHFAAPLLSVEVVPGISALSAAAARLGAPLMHDFACISLSDRLTPWQVIETRLNAAAAADFVIVLYNPRSKGRSAHINRAREVILKHRSKNTIVGIVRGAMREHERITVTDLGGMQENDVDMQTTVIIGNSKTFRWNNLMVTPRGYENKFEI
jgi:cobalt-precorrin 5A hydrolase/precorrin-3B C17-methyltransferase